MRKPRAPSFKGIGRLSGDKLGALRVRIFECNGCHTQHRAEAGRPGQKSQKPTQCLNCGRMDFSTIDSIHEARRLGTLRLLQHAGRIRDLERQRKFPLYAFCDGSPVKVGEYWSDFVYTRCEDDQQVIEDVKPDHMTDLAAWKLRHMAAQGTPVTIINPKG